jgi:L-fucono-1,5-lactonase
MLDAHVHLWDTNAVSYELFDDDPQLAGPHTPAMYLEEALALGIKSAIVVEAASAGADGLAEARWIADQVSGDPRYAGLVAWAPLESTGLDAYLEQLLALEGVRIVGVRRSFEFERPDFPSAAGVVAGTRRAGALGLTVDLVVFSRSLGTCVDLARSAPDTQFVLDHVGKPALVEGELGRWAADLASLAALPNVSAKLSGLITEMSGRWSVAVLRPFVDHALECFGPERLMLGSDWPIVNRGGGMRRWLAALETLLSQLTPSEQLAIRQHTATQVYRLGVL